MYLFSIALILFITEITSLISLIWFWQKFICFSLPYFYILHWAWCFWSHGGYFTVRILPSYEFTGTFIFVLFIFFACLFLGRTKNITLILCLVGLPLFLTSSNFALFFFFLKAWHLCHHLSALWGKGTDLSLWLLYPQSL